MYKLVLWLAKYVDPAVIKDMLGELTAKIDPDQVLTWALDWYIDRAPAFDRLAALGMAEKWLTSALKAIRKEATDERKRLGLMSD